MSLYGIELNNHPRQYSDLKMCTTAYGIL